MVDSTEADPDIDRDPCNVESPTMLTELSALKGPPIDTLSPEHQNEEMET
jgi:hypothetical protein